MPFSHDSILTPEEIGKAKRVNGAGRGGLAEWIK
jgi:hypothetical protein